MSINGEFLRAVEVRLDTEIEEDSSSSLWTTRDLTEGMIVGLFDTVSFNERSVCPKANKAVINIV
jgi:hypothetical protein